MAQMDGLYVGAMKRAVSEGRKVRFLKSYSGFIWYDKNIENCLKNYIPVKKIKL